MLFGIYANILRHDFQKKPSCVTLKALVLLKSIGPVDGSSTSFLTFFSVF